MSPALSASVSCLQNAEYQTCTGLHKAEDFSGGQYLVTVYRAVSFVPLNGGGGGLDAVLPGLFVVPADAADVKWDCG